MRDTDAPVQLTLRSDAVEAVVVDTLRSRVASGVACAVVDGSSPLAHFGRDLEIARFPEFDMVAEMAPFEASSVFIYTVDVDRGRIAHVKRVVRGNDAATTAATGRTLIEVLDDRVGAGDPAERATLEELLAHHGIADPAEAWNISTSCASERVMPTRQRPYSLYSFKALLWLTDPIGIAHFFAYANEKTARGMARMGIRSTRLGGRDFHLPVGDAYDPAYVAIHMHSDDSRTALTVPDAARPLGRPVAAYDVPIVVILDDDDVVIDLTEASRSPRVQRARPARVLLESTAGDAVLDLTDGHEGVLDLTERSASPAPSRERGGA